MTWTCRGRKITEDSGNYAIAPVMGKTIVLSIDRSIQTLAEKALGERMGIDRAMLNDYQRDFPVTQRPFAHLARRLEIGEDEVLIRLKRLSKAGYIARIGAAVRPNTVGAAPLAALAVDPDRLEEVAATVSAMPGVNHNYARDHRLNLWFVVTEPDREKVAETLAAVARATGLTPLSFPLTTGYHIDLGFPLWPQ